MSEPIEALITAAENMLYTLPLVPTAPLAEAQDLVGRLYSQPAVAPEDWPKALHDLADAIEGVEWSFWPPEQFGSRQAFVSIDNLMAVAECLEKLKKEIGNAGQD